MKKHNDFQKKIILKFSLMIVIFILFSGIIIKDAQAEEPSWDQIVNKITSKDDLEGKKKLNCIIELIFGEKGQLGQGSKNRIINFSFVFPNTLPDPVISVDLLRGSSSEEKNILKLVNDLHSAIVTTFKLSSAQCPYCEWPFVLPKVATSKEKIDNFLIFSEKIPLDDSFFKDEAKSTIAYDQDSLNSVWSDEQTDSGIEVLDVFLNRDSLITPNDVKPGFHQINNSDELWNVVEDAAKRIPLLNQTLSLLESRN